VEGLWIFLVVLCNLFFCALCYYGRKGYFVRWWLKALALVFILPVCLLAISLSITKLNNNVFCAIFSFVFALMTAVVVGLMEET